MINMTDIRAKARTGDDIVKDCTFCKNLLKYTKKKKLHYQTEEMVI